ncbi:MAG: ABC transporter ATP-binding protein [Micromonosporaceae bacterium]|nr:ABC transporter ATP-binding protein [Micromonosporaceae bacterium]
MRAALPCLGLVWRAGRGLTLALVGFACVGGAAPIVVAWLTKHVLDSVVSASSTSSVVFGAAALAGTGIVAGVLPYLQQYVQQLLERRVSRFSQGRLYGATERLVGLARFEDPVFADKLRLARQYGGATPIIVVTSLFSTGRALITAFGFIAILLRMAPWLPAMVVVSALPALVLELRQARRQVRTAWTMGPVERREFFYRELLSDAQAAKEIRLFGLGGYFRERMQDERQRSDTAKNRLDRIEVRLRSTMAVLSGLTGAVALIWAAPAAAAGQITVGDVSIVVSSLAVMQAGILNAVRDTGKCHAQLRLFGHYQEVVEMSPDLPMPEDPTPVPTLRQGITFHDVWFRYGPDRPWVLRGVSFTIPAGQSVGLVGRNGAGKTTIVKLLLRMYDPTRGQILWDGIDVREFSPDALRASIGAVFQDFMCYDLTARENIRLGDLASSDQRIELAASESGAAGFIEPLPRGYETLLSRIFSLGEPEAPELGTTLSGGQWQRIALARAYLRINRDLLILDEPSSGLDAEAEFEVHQGLRRERTGRTCVLISHRLGAIRDADLLLVLSAGVIVEAGTHEELMEMPEGCYSRLFRMQASGYVDRPAGAGMGVSGDAGMGAR